MRRRVVEVGRNTKYGIRELRVFLITSRSLHVMNWITPQGPMEKIDQGPVPESPILPTPRGCRSNWREDRRNSSRIAGWHCVGYKESSFL